MVASEKLAELRLFVHERALLDNLANQVGKTGDVLRRVCNELLVRLDPTVEPTERGVGLIDQHLDSIADGAGSVRRIGIFRRHHPGRRERAFTQGRERRSHPSRQRRDFIGLKQFQHVSDRISIPPNQHGLAQNDRFATVFFAEMENFDFANAIDSVSGGGWPA